MKAKITRGGGFRGALNYAFDKGKVATGDKQAERVGGNMAGSNPQDLSAEFSVMRQLRPDIEKPVWHCSLSLPAGERLDSDRWGMVAEDFMNQMGLNPDNNPYVAVRHSDTEHDHIHIIASRVGLDGQVWHGKWEARRAIDATQELEKIHGLTMTPGLGEAKTERKAPTTDEIGMAERRGELTPRERLQQTIDKAIKDKPSAAELAERLEAAGVTVRANIASTGRMNGFSFEVDGLAYKGADLGAAYKWKGLQERGVTYDSSRDSEALSKFKTTNTAPGSEPRKEGRDSRELRKEYAEQWKPAQQAKREKAWESQRELETERRAAVKTKFLKRRDSIRNDKNLSPSKRKAQLSIARMTKVQEDVHLRETISRERAELKAGFSHTQYLDFLTEKAQVGDGLALSELRDRTAEPRHERRERSIDAPDITHQQERESPIMQSLAYNVARNGNVTYRDDRGRDVIEDAGQRVNVLNDSDKAIDLGLRLAVQKFGSQVGLTGTEEFKRAVVETAVKAGMKVDFKDHALNQYKNEYEQKLQTGRERIQDEKNRNSSVNQKDQQERSDQHQRQRDEPGKERGR